MHRTRRSPLWILMTLSLFGISMLIGCIYLPVGEHPADNQKDFRPLLAKKNPAGPIRERAITRAQTIKLLGPPTATYDQNRRALYTFSTESGVWINLLCFRSDPAKKTNYDLTLIFDDQDLLIDAESFHHAGG